MIDVGKLIHSFRLRWLGKILDETDGNWKDMANLYFELLGGIKLLLNCSVDLSMMEKYFARKIPSFYLELLEAWYCLCYSLKICLYHWLQ